MLVLLSLCQTVNATKHWFLCYSNELHMPWGGFYNLALESPIPFPGLLWQGHSEGAPWFSKENEQGPE